jgi:hypothetical protein
MEILKQVIQKSLLILIPAAAVSAFFEWKKLPLGIIAGGLLGIVNFRGLVKNIEGLLGTARLTAKILFFTMTRLLILLAVILLLVWSKTINVFGLIFGFTVVFFFILIEGMKVSKSQ